VAEGAPLLREYVGKTCIEGSNPSRSAKLKKPPSGGFFNLMVRERIQNPQVRSKQSSGLFWTLRDFAQWSRSDLICGLLAAN
jgi:hypothetical protein